MKPLDPHYRLVMFLSAFVLAMLLAGSAMAQTSPFCTFGMPPCDPQDPTSKCFVPDPPCVKCEPKVCKKCTTSPVYAGQGVYTNDAVDLSLPTAGFPLVASRNYSSAHAIDGPTGLGWSSSFHARLHYAAYLFAAPSTYQLEAEVVMADGAHYRFSGNADGSFTPPAGRYDVLVKNVDGTFDMTLQRSRSKLHFGPDGALLSMTDDYGNALTFTYDGSGRVQRMADTAGSGRYLDLTWGPNGRISAIADNSGRTVQYTYDSQGLLTSVTNAAGQTTTYTYVAGRFAPVLSQIKDHWGRIISDVTWDAQSRVKSYTEDGETYTYTYAAVGRTEKSDSAGNLWTFPYDADGLITQRQPPNVSGTGIEYTTYNADGTVQLATDAVGVKTFYTYAGQGRVASVTKDYQGSSAIEFDYAYDAGFFEKVASVLPKNTTTGANEPNWQGWKYDYYDVTSPAPGALHHVYRLHDDGVTTDTIATYVYDTHGRVTSVTAAGGGVSDYAYDAYGNLSTVTAPTNNDAGTRPVTSYGYDAVGRVTSVTDPLGKVTTYQYDTLDRITSVTPPKPVAGSALDFTTTYSYDNFDATSGLTFTNVTDPNATLTKQGYDQFGRVRKSIDAAGNATAHAYTTNLLTSITDANGNVTSYQYDGVKRLTGTVFPDGASESYTYYADGLLKTKRDRKNQTITYTYDTHKRLTRKTYPNSSYIQYSYTGQKLIQVYDNLVSPAETHTFAYDERFRVSSNTQATRGTVGYTYDTGDRTASYAVMGGASASYTYYADGSLNTITWSAVTGHFKYAYRANGQYQTVTFPNSQTRSYSYDDQGRLTQIANVHPTAGNLATFAYGYDLNNMTSAFTRLGQRTSMTANVPSQSLSSALTRYYYDTNYQLTRADYPSAAPFGGEAHSWTYDAIGNRLTNTVNGTTATYAYQKIGSNPNNWQRLTSDGASAYTYDANGNTGSRAGDTFGWDYENRLTSISGGTAATYKYDYQGRRTEKTVGTTTTTFLYDGPNLISQTGAQYVFGPRIDEPLAVGDGSNTSYYQIDGLGSVAGVNDGAGAVQNSYAFDSWGTARTRSETAPNAFGYTARELDEGGLQFYRARYFSPAIARFLSEDPIEFLGGINFYRYVNNSPTVLIDPYGYQGQGGRGPTYPPMPVPGAPDSHWIFHPNPNPENRGHYSPDPPVPGGSQPEVSWHHVGRDKPGYPGHWDMDDPNNPENTGHYDPRGNRIPPESGDSDKAKICIPCALNDLNRRAFSYATYASFYATYKFLNGCELIVRAMAGAGRACGCQQ